MLTDQKIVKLRDRLPEVQRRLKEVTAEIKQLSEKQAHLAKFCRLISRVTEVHEGIPLSVGNYFTRAVSTEHFRYAHYRTNPADSELRPKDMRWLIMFIDHPPCNADGTTNREVVGKLYDVKNRKEAVELAKKWIVEGREWLATQLKE